MTAEGEEPPKLRSRLKRFAPLLLIAGALGAAVTVVPHIPRERAIDVDLPEPASILGVEISWLEPGPRNEPIQGATWKFSPGAAPKRLRTTVSLPKGRYDLDITVTRPEGDATTRRSIDVDDADHFTVRLH